jgi:hypothetical protein
MRDNDRKYTSLIYVLSIAFTLISAIKYESASLVVIFVIF